jgi:hypothetical protein
LLRNVNEAGITIELVFHFQGSSIEGRDLGGHQAIFGLIRVGSAIGLGKKGSICPPLNIDDVANDEGPENSYSSSQAENNPNKAALHYRQEDGAYKN